MERFGVVEFKDTHIAPAGGKQLGGKADRHGERLNLEQMKALYWWELKIRAIRKRTSGIYHTRRAVDPTKVNPEVPVPLYRALYYILPVLEMQSSDDWTTAETLGS